jgi:N-acetylated-alpha-linked acidic dipeptidase
VQFLSYGPGDPGTPGWASTKGSKRIAYEKLETISRIPSLPIGYGPAGELLSRLAGQEVPGGWQGGLPFAYHTGPGPVEIEMSVEMDYAVRPIWNVITRIPGTVEPDLEVVIGNHRDAWTYGAVDPNSGTAAVLEMAKAFSEAMKEGWKPRRTLVLASWDGEEYGLLGSTEWAEHHADEIRNRVIAYLNMDSAVSGPDLGVGGVASLRNLIFAAAGSVLDPRKGKSLYELWEDRRRDAWANGPIDRSDPAKLLDFDPQLDPLGSGSDYTVFLDHLGVASADLRLSGRYGVYHSTYDDLYWMEHFCDPEMIHHATATRLLGLAAMRAASAELFPFRFAPVARALRQQLDDVQLLLLRKARKAKPADKKQPIRADWARIEKALEELGDAGTALDAALDAALAGGRAGGPPSDAALRAANAAMREVEHRLIDPEGLPGRTWFRHLVSAPGLSTGYAPWPFPGVRQAVEEADQAMFDREAPRIEARLRAAASSLRAIAALDGLGGER